MTATEDSNAFVETPTDYGTNTLDCDQTIELHIGGVSNDTATYISQQLSLFVETHDTEAFKRTVGALQSAVDDFEEFAIEVGTPSEIPADCYWPIELEVEEISFDAAHQIVGTLTQLAAEGFEGPMLNDVRCSLIDATDDQPRSIVRLVKNDGSQRNALEWHTDTEAELESAEQ
jgi:hypothetical protein